MATKEEWRDTATRVVQLIDKTPRVHPHSLLQSALDDLKILDGFFTLAITVALSNGSAKDAESALAYELAISSFKSLWQVAPSPARTLDLLVQHRFLVRKIHARKKICGEKEDRLVLAQFLAALTKQGELVPAV